MSGGDRSLEVMSSRTILERVRRVREYYSDRSGESVWIGMNHVCSIIELYCENVIDCRTWVDGSEGREYLWALSRYEARLDEEVFGI